MQRPTIIWTGYNLFRLVAVAFMSWALVAQFIAIANDLDAYSNAPDSVPNPSPVLIGDARASDTSSSAPGSSPSISSRLETSLQAALPTAVTSSSTHHTTSSISIPTSSVPSLQSHSTLTSTIHDGVVILDPLGGTQILANFARTSAASTVEGHPDTGGFSGLLRRIEDESAQTEDVGYVGASSVPDQPGGVFFLLLSRLVMAVLLGGLILVRVGYPETWLYRHVTWLGPQSTPLSLGGHTVGVSIAMARVIPLLIPHSIAVENLHVYEKPSILIPAWGLLGIGSANLLIAASLLYFKRKQIRPDRYILSLSLSVRALYWIPPPPFYRSLTDRSTVGSEFSATQRTGDIEDSEKGGRPSHDTAYDLGESDSEDENFITIDPVPPIARKHLRKQPEKAPQVQQTRQLGELRDDQDVRKGGYPTFARGGIDQPGRHVPAGFIEQRADGQLLRYVGEEAREATPPTRKARPEEKTEDRPVRSAQPPTESSKRHTVLRQPPSRKRTMDTVRKEDDQARKAGAPIAVAEPHLSARGANDRTAKDENQVMVPHKQNLSEPPQTSNQRMSTHRRVDVDPTEQSTSLPLPPPTRKRKTDPLTPIREAREESAHSSPSGSASHIMMTPSGGPVYDEPESIDNRRPAKSLLVAANDFGPLFPLPPSRPTLAIEAASSAKANRQGSGDSVRKPSPAKDLPPLPLPAESASEAQPIVCHPMSHHRELGDVPKTPTPPLGDGTLEVRETRSRDPSPLKEAPVQRLSDAKSDKVSRQSVVQPLEDYFSAVTPTTALLATTRQVSGHGAASSPGGSLTVTSSKLDDHAFRTSYQVSAGRPPQVNAQNTNDSPHLRPGSSLSRLRSSMAIPRSPSSRSIHSNRTAQGVRFDLSPISVSSGGSQSAPTSPTRSLSPFSPAPKAGLRIPGTRLTVSLPRFTAPGTPKPNSMESFTSEEGDAESDGDWSELETARPESMLSGRSATPAETDEGAQGKPGPKRSNTIDTLGGQYLDGGQEKRSQRHRRHSSVDSLR